MKIKCAITFIIISCLAFWDTVVRVLKENNAWTWNLSVQHDIPGLIEMMGGKEAFIKRLDALFNEPTHISKWKFMGQFPYATGLNGKYSHRWDFILLLRAAVSMPLAVLFSIQYKFSCQRVKLFFIKL
jgi:hypothetical protein